MERSCIICKVSKNVSLFNIEHVFPAAIGGVFTTDIVCTSCNTLLNQNIDEPFVKSNFVLAYRHHYNLNRDQKRSIPNITKAVVKNAEGADALIKFENGQLKSEVVDQFSYNINENGEISCTLTLDGSKLNDVDSIIRNKLERLSKKLAIDRNTNYTIISTNKTETKPFHVILNVPHNLLIKQCVKIAYEIACLTTSNYLLDDHSKVLSEFLITNSISKELQEYLDNTGVGKFQKYMNRFKILNIPLHQHAILIDNVESEGVYGVVKIFQYIYPVLLTKNTELFPKEEFLLVNDALSRTMSCNHLLNYKLVDCKVELKNLDKEKIETIKKTGLPSFEVTNNSWVFYNHIGKVKYENINSLSISIIKSENLIENPNTGILAINLDNKNTFIKTTDGDLVQILSISVIPEIVMGNLPA